MAGRLILGFVNWRLDDNTGLDLDLLGTVGSQGLCAPIWLGCGLLGS